MQVSSGLMLFVRHLEQRNLTAPVQMQLGVGLGNMGLAMARNLQEYLEKEKNSGMYDASLHVWNRTQSKAQALLDQGASLAPSIPGESSARVACTPCLTTDTLISEC